MPNGPIKSGIESKPKMTDKPTTEQERNAAVALAKWLGSSEMPANRLQGFYRESPDLKAVVQAVETGRLTGVKALCTKNSDVPP